ncbi:nucleoside-diphosphate kinase [Patescibacteria group bacterium]|nr:nucleoside-diphosphate kinase [Patescibacteria group bacterium]
MATHPKNERSFVIIKPDGVQRGLVGDIVKRFERTGLKLVYMRLAMLDETKLWTHYGKDDAWFEKKGQGIANDRAAAGMSVDKEPIEYGKDIIRALVKFMTSGPVVVMVLEGNQAVAVVKKLVGGTEPATSDVGTIRGDLTLDSYAIAAVDDRAVRNLIHCSDAPEEGEREIALWISKEDLINYRLVGEQILYDVNLDGILE